MKMQNSNLVGKKRSYFGHASDQVTHELLGISQKDCLPESGLFFCFLFFWPWVAQLDNNNNKDPTSPGISH